jgi:hypothetical protein
LRAKKGLNASATLGYGSFNTRQASAFVNHKPGDWDYLISASYLASDNDFNIYTITTPSTIPTMTNG